MPSSKSVTSNERHNSTTRSTSGVSSFVEEGEEADTGKSNEKVMQLRAMNRRLKEERDQIGKEYDAIKRQLDTSTAEKGQLLDDRKRLEAELMRMQKQHSDNDILRDRITELQREGTQLRAEAEKFKKARRDLKTDNETLTSYLTAAIEEKETMETQLRDAQAELDEVKRKLDDEISISTYAKEKAEKEAKQRQEEIAKLKEQYRKLELEFRTQSVEFAARLATRESDIKELREARESLTNELEWLRANQQDDASSEQRRPRLDDFDDDDGEELQHDPNGGRFGQRDDSIMESSKLEDLDDFLDGIQKLHGKGMKNQSADPQLLRSIERPDMIRSPNTIGGSRQGKSPKARPSIMRRLSTIFQFHPS